MLLPAILGLTGLSPSLTTAVGPCDSPSNPIVAENCQPGNPATEWDIVGAGDSSIQGFATDISVDQGQTVQFKIKSDATSYRLDIYRLGYYGGAGARKIATVLPSAALPQTQPSCLSDSATGLVDCGNWAVSASWAVPSNAVSGIYLAKLVRTDPPNDGKSSHVVFVVRDDDGHSDLLFQTSDTTWQAYNEYGGNSLYTGAPAGRAYKVSYNRPFTTRTAVGGKGALTWLFGAEYPMVRWLEANGYSVSYTTGLDGDRRGSEMLEHKAYLSVGHDEYWSAAQRSNAEAARAAGVNLAFFSGNQLFWKTRWENSIDGSNTPYRTLVSYKDTHANAAIDPTGIWTGTWRDPRFSPPADGGKPENALTGTIFTVNCCRYDPVIVPSADGKMRFWRNTSVSSLPAGQSASLAAGSVGHEVNEDLDNGFRPAGLIHLSTGSFDVGSYLLDYGTTYGSGHATHTMTLYRHSGGALVFDAGTIQYAWALDSAHDNPQNGPSATSVELRQATVNLLADMQVQPATIQAGLVAATTSADTVAPASTISTPASGSTVVSGSMVTISGTATDAGGGVVGGVEISVDGGTTWHPTSGRESWTYSWTPGTTGTAVIRTRAADDSGNLEHPSAGVSVTVQQRNCPCSIWSSTATPSAPNNNDGQPIELGVRFRSDVAGYVTGVRFYKGSANTGAHVGSLWSATGAQLASATFAGESASGWQQVSFAAPVQIAANTTYVASYFSPGGGYSSTPGMLAAAGVDNAPLHALASGVDGGNGLYKYGPTGFPTNAFNGGNYWVDVVFSTASPTGDTTPPTISGVQAGAVTGTGATVTWSTDEAADSQVEYGPSTSYGSSTTLDPSLVTAHSVALAGLQPGTQYHYRVKSRDLAGNLATSVDNSFTTGAAPPPPTCPCSIWPDTAIPSAPNNNDGQPIELGVRFRSDVAGYVTGVRFYKGTANTGAHVGSLWSNTGTQLASATFAGESAGGWQQVSFAAPVQVAANTTYVASYFSPGGGYSSTPGMLAAAGVDNAPLHALASGVDGGNGLYKYGPTGFPTNAFNGGNYWVDVVFSTAPPAPDTTPPTVTTVTPANGATGAAVGVNVTATFSEAMNSTSLTTTTVTLTPQGSTTPVAGAVTYNAATLTVTLNPTGNLQRNVTYTARIKGGAGGAQDAAGNVLATDKVWTFTTTP